MSTSNENTQNSNSCGKIGCQVTIALLIIGGWLVNKGGLTSGDCVVCGSYNYKEFTENVFSDNKLAETIGADKVEEYKKRLKNESSATHVLTLSDPKTLDDGTIRGTAMFGIQAKFVNGLIAYKGTFIKIKEDEKYDGMIRIEYKRNDVTDSWEQIAFSNNENIIFYKIKDKNLLLTSGTTGDTYGICCYKEATFVKD